MKIIKSLKQLPTFDNSVVTIGSFDGVHLGHRQIFKYLKEVAQHTGGESIVITFEPHPQELLNPNSDFFRINTLDEKIELINKEGLDYLVILPFTHELASMSFQDFFEKILIHDFNVKTLVMGPNHTFGKDRQGNIMHISELAKQKNIEIKLIPEFMINDCAVRSRKIRECIQNENNEEAMKLLGHNLIIDRKKGKLE